MNTDGHVLVIGDIILDKYINGHYIQRVDDEGNNIFCEEEIIYKAGGAGNVVCNIAQSTISTTLLGILGTDMDSSRCRSILKQSSVDTSMLVIDCAWNIPIITRYMDHNKQIFRSDRETHIEINEYRMCSIIKALEENICNFNSILMVDYQRGLLTADIISEIMKLAAHYKKKIIVDTKSTRLSPFTGSYLIKMNHKELQRVTGITCSSLDNIQKAAFQIMKQFQCQFFLTTWSKNGIILSSNKESSIYIENKAKSPLVCTIGAGDTVTAYLLIGIENNLTPEHCLLLANSAAKYAVSRPMTTVLHDPLPNIQSLRKTVNFKYINKDGGIEYEQNGTWNQYWT